jgi:Luciferase
VHAWGQTVMEADEVIEKGGREELSRALHWRDVGAGSGRWRRAGGRGHQSHPPWQVTLCFSHGNGEAVNDRMRATDRMSARGRGGGAQGGSPRRFRGLGRGRASRRVLARGGTGLARNLNDALARWAQVRITPLFGRWGYFIGSQLFACFPLAPRQHDLWVRLPLSLQARAVGEEGVRPHRRFGRRGWIEMDVKDAGDVARALRWLRRAHAAAQECAWEEHGAEDDFF